ncbi:MAG: glutamate synthase small chain [Kosmotogales bacterium]|nr:glutamate synthase small chain [Kosmotogales bacterium]
MQPNINAGVIVMQNRNKTKMKIQDPEARIKNFREVALGYSFEDAKEEAQRCLNCKNPQCISGCPVNVDIRGFIQEIKKGNFENALKIIKNTNGLPAICGRVCPQEKQCEERCVLGKIGEPVAIGRLERFLGDNFSIRTEPPSKKREEKIAIIGGGPSGITAAIDLRKEGFDVTIFEAFPKLGGVLLYGIPQFRLPKEIVETETNELKNLGIKIETNHIIGRSLPFEKIVEEYDAIYIGIGAGAPRFMGIPGTNLKNVFSSSEILTRVNLMKAYEFPEYGTPVFCKEKAAVIGAGNVTMDVARTLKRLGAEEVTIIYRRTENEVPARKEEFDHAREEGVNFLWLTQPIEYLPDETKTLKAIKCIKMELGEPDSSGRRKPIPIEGSEFILDFQMVVEAIGQKSNSVLKAFEGLQLNKWGYIDVNEETLQTNIENVFAGGDIVTGSATVILAMGAGKKAAESILAFLNEKKEVKTL